MKTLWICGQWVGGSPWEFQGIFSTKEKAIAACKDDLFFIAPVELDQELPDESRVFKGAYYPLAEGDA